MSWTGPIRRYHLQGWRTNDAKNCLNQQRSDPESKVLWTGYTFEYTICVAILDSRSLGRPKTFVELSSPRNVASPTLSIYLWSHSYHWRSVTPKLSKERLQHFSLPWQISYPPTCEHSIPIMANYCNTFNIHTLTRELS